MISRRSLLKLITASCACCRSDMPALAWVSGKCGTLSSTSVRENGCMLTGELPPDMLSRVRFFVDDGNPKSGFVFRAQTILKRYYGVDPDLTFYDDGDNVNAFATRQRITAACNTDGAIIIGKKLIASEMEASPGYWGTSLMFILAHEYSHIAQFKHGLDFESPNQELHADYVAGWFLGTIVRVFPTAGINFEIAKRTVESKVATKSGAPESHGTTTQRIASLSAGYNCGRDNDFDIGMALTKGRDFLI